MKSHKNSEIQENIGLLHDSDLEVRLKAIRTLGIIGDANTVTTLLELLDDPDIASQPYKYAVYSDTLFSLQFLLTQFPNQKAEEKLIQILTDKSEIHDGYRAWCAEVLGNINSKKAFPILIEMLTSAPPRVQETAAFALGLMGDEAALPALQNLVSHQAVSAENAKVIKEANEAIQRIISRQKREGLP